MKEKKIYIHTHTYIYTYIHTYIPAGLLASFPCKLNTFRQGDKNVVTSKGVKMGTECK